MFPAGVINQNAPHNLGGDGKELRTVFPANVLPIDHPQVSLVDKCGGLQGVIGALVLHIRRGEMAQVFIDNFEQLARRAVVPRAHAIKENCHVMCWTLFHHSVPRQKGLSIPKTSAGQNPNRKGGTVLSKPPPRLHRKGGTVPLKAATSLTP